MNDISYRIKKIMGDLSVRKFAQEIRMSPTTVQEYVKGRMPSAEFVVRVCERYHLNSWWLLTGEGEEKQKATVGINEGEILYSSTLSVDPVTARVDALMTDMSEEARRDVLKYAEEKKLLSDLMEDRRGQPKRRKAG